LENEYLIKEFRPTIYFEYDLDFNESDAFDSIEVIKLFSSLGYGFIVYDNYGNLVNVIECNCEEEFTKLNHYLMSCRMYGGGIQYFDVLATSNKLLIKDIWANDNR
jgi:hypothetical protein